MWDVVTGLDVCMDVIVSGNVVPKFGDTEQYVEDYAVEMGGSGGIFISQCAKLGLSALGVGTIGADAFGAMYESAYRGTGADASRLRRDPARKTGMGLCLIEGSDRSILTYGGTIDGVTGEDLSDEVLINARHLHVASYFLLKRLRPSVPDLIRRAKRLGLTVSMDTNWDPDDEWAGVESLLPELDCFLPNEHEARALGGTERLSWRTPLLVVKRGEAGAEAYKNGALVARAGAYETACADAVGAGDSFDAGFVAARLRGKSIEDCLKYGCACGGMNVRERGGLRGQGTLAEIERVVRSGAIG